MQFKFSLRYVKYAIKWYIAATIWENLGKFFKTHGKRNDHTMTKVWIMENIVIIPWPSHESWRPCQEIWPPCCHHGTIMTVFCHDHGMAAMFFPTSVNFAISCFYMARDPSIVQPRMLKSWPIYNNLCSAIMYFCHCNQTNLATCNKSSAAMPFCKRCNVGRFWSVEINFAFQMKSAKRSINCYPMGHGIAKREMAKLSDKTIGGDIC